MFPSLPRGVQNIEGMYDYEMREADAVYQVGVATLKKSLSDELQAKVLKAQEAAGNLPSAPTAKTTRGGAAAAAAAAASTANSGAEPKGNHGGVAPASTRVQRQLEALGSSARTSFALNEALTDAEVRGDLRRIVEDLNERAKLFAESLDTSAGGGSGPASSKDRPPGHVFEAVVTMNK